VDGVVIRRGELTAGRMTVCRMRGLQRIPQYGAPERPGVDVNNREIYSRPASLPMPVRERALGTNHRVSPGALVMMLLVLALTLPSNMKPPVDQVVQVIVRTDHGLIDAAERLVLEVGGAVGRRIPIIDGFVATIPIDEIEGLQRSNAIVSLTPDATVRLLGNVDGIDPNKYPGSWSKVARNTKLTEMWHSGWTGAGIDVALIDSGVAPVPGMALQVINGPDLSFESQATNLTDIDTYGHGTHMAGLIAGRDEAIRPGREDEDVDRYFVGAAPGSRIVSIKVAASDGATDVSQVIAAIDWVVQHRDSDGLNIRVLNLSFGTDGTQDYMLDPLAYAVEVAWLHGIVVVVAAGNSGFGTAQLNDPAYDPYVIAVGADDTKGTDYPKDDSIPSWQTRGNGLRHPDIVAPGKSIISLRDPGSFVDEANPAARTGNTPRFFRGSGSSQAAAIVSGAVATLLQQHPELTPDQVKALLMQTATPLPNADPVSQGAGLLNLHRAREAKLSTVAGAVQTWPRSTGLGSLQLARGSVTTDDGGVVLQGEQTVFGDAWDATTWTASSWDGTSWSGGDWSGRTWSGDCWCGSSWSGRTWSGRTWSGSAWSGRTWSGRSWSGRTWSGSGWSSGSWDSDAPSSLSAGAWTSTLWGD
jgi:subtilisin family serine protease